MSLIHPTVMVAPTAELDTSVEVVLYSVIGEHVKIDAGTKVGPHCVIDGHTTIGKNNLFYRFCSIGGLPIYNKYAAEPTALEIGDDNTVREYVTINTGTVQDVGVTRVGCDIWIMAYVHIAHDCQIGSHTIIANSVQLAGHIHIGDWAVLGGLSAVYQFVRIVAHAMIGGSSSIRKYIRPYLIGAGDHFRIMRINSEGLKRRDFDEQSISALKKAYRILYRQKLSLDEAVAAMNELELDSEQARQAVQTLVQFVQSSTRGFARP